MKVTGKTIQIPNTLWVQHGGVNIKNKGEEVILEAVDEDSYLKVFNHFGRVLKLYIYDGKQWVDSSTGSAPIALDESRAGRVPPAPHTSRDETAGKKETPAKANSRAKSAAKSKSSATAPAKKTGTKKVAAGTAKSTGKDASATRHKSAAKPAAKSRAKALSKTGKRGV